MNATYFLCLPCSVAALIFLHTHTDELPIVLGSVLILSAVLGVAFPRRWLISLAAVGASLFVAELLVQAAVLRAPWRSAPGIPWVALVAYVPALVGISLGAGLRRYSVK